MKYASFLRPDGAEGFGIVSGDCVHDLSRYEGAARDLREHLGRGSPMPKDFGEADYLLADLRLLPVIPRPGKIFCIGLNYRAHIEETGRSDSEHPVVFMRTATSQTAHGQHIVKPSFSDKFDYEGELAVIIGSPGRGIALTDALGHVAGFACYNDVTVRDWQKHTHQWTPGKNFDGTGAFGPWMVTADELPDRSVAKLTTRLNSEVVQQATLAQMVFSIEELISYISTFTTLEPGDVIVSGTPGGVGDKRTPPLYMKPGDVVEVEIDGVGLLSNAIAAA